MKKYRTGKLWWAAVILTILAALETPFNTGTYSLFFKLMESKRLDLLLPFVLFYIAVYALLYFIRYLKEKEINRYQAQTLTRLKMDCIKDSIHNSKDVSVTLSFLDNDLKLLAEQYFGNIFQLIQRISIAVSTLFLTLASNWGFALIYLALGLLPLKLTNHFSKKVSAKTSSYSDSTKQSTAAVKDVVRNRETLLNYNAMQDALGRVKKAVFSSETSLAERNSQLACTNFQLNIIYTVLSILPIAIGIYMAIKGYLSISAFVAVQYSSGWIVGSLRSLAGLASGIKSTRPIRERIENFSDYMPASDTDYEDVQTIEFSHVDFSYTPKKPILQDFSFRAASGSKTLIQGPSGSGKSTVLKLISGELEPTGGVVLLNGQKLFHRRIGYVTQNPAIFRDTLWYNLTLGADFSAEKLQEAIDKSGLSDFAAQKGLDFVLAEEGGNVSGGQKQRIEIARALLYDCSVLLVDEGTSALDDKTATQIHDTIMGLDKTVIEVAHYIPVHIKNHFDTILTLQG